MEYFEEIGASTGYAPFVLSKMSISMSLKSGKPLKEQDFHSDTYGLELNRQTITGEWDELFKCLIEMFEGKHINDDDYVQKYLNGASLQGKHQLPYQLRHSFQVE